jgi:CRP-like cAMP-binding protein
MREQTIEAGQLIYERGQEADSIFFIVDGEVELADPDGGEAPWRFGPGSVIGVLDMNIERPRSRSASAIGPVELLTVRRTDWLEFYEDNLDFSALVRRVQGGGIHQFHAELGAGGGFERYVPPPERAAEAAKIEDTLVERLVALRECSFLQTARVQAIVELAQRCRMVRGRRGEQMLLPGGAGSGLYVVLAGVVRIERRIAPALEASFARGDLVLGGAAFGGGLNEYSVTALTDAALVRLATADLDDVGEDHFDVVRAILRGLALERERLMKIRERRKSEIPPAPASSAA